ncbi:hypothetical protein PSHI_23100 [Pseudomonas sp. URMO17WK12:I11]|nr:hypothetical protein PSHI_23100 [Pseudomonas sp. URMO17WK12:I11]
MDIATFRTFQRNPTHLCKRYKRHKKHLLLKLLQRQPGIALIIKLRSTVTLIIPKIKNLLIQRLDRRIINSPHTVLNQAKLVKLILPFQIFLSILIDRHNPAKPRAMKRQFCTLAKHPQKTFRKQTCKIQSTRASWIGRQFQQPFRTKNIHYCALENCSITIIATFIHVNNYVVVIRPIQYQFSRYTLRHYNSPTRLIFETSFLKITLPLLTSQLINILKKTSMIVYLRFIPSHRRICLVIAFKLCRKIKIQLC